MRRVTLLVTAALLSGGAQTATATGRSSCPVTTAIRPFATTDLSRYAVDVVDGGPGDADGAANGLCEVDLRACVGAGDPDGVACSPTAVDGVRVNVRGRLLRERARDVEQALAADLPAVGDGPRSADADPDPSCGERRVTLPAGGDRGEPLRLVVAARTRDGGRRSERHTATVAVRCVHPAADGASEPTCRARGAGSCPGRTEATPAADGAADAPPADAGTPTTGPTTPLPDDDGLPPDLPPDLPPTDATPPAADGGGETLVAGGGRTYWLAPNGSDRSSGTSAGTAWRTFARGLAALRPGDTLVLADGTYTRGTNGMPKIDCAHGLARSGTATAPITLRAAHERRAYVVSDGYYDALEMSGCAWWQLVGLHASSADNSAARPWDGNVVEIIGGHDIVLSRLLAHRPNTRCAGSAGYCNGHAISISNARNVLVEESEVYDFHRHGISVFASRWVTVRRSYANPRAMGGATGIMLYGASDSIVENSIAEGSTGVNIAGTPLYDGTAGGYRNRLLGVITLGNVYGSTIRSRRFGGPVRPVGDNLVRDSVFANTRTVGVFSRGAANTVLDHVTVIGTVGSDGIAADEDAGEAHCSSNPRGCSITVRNVLACINAGQGVRVDQRVVRTWSIESSDSVANRGGNWPTSESAGDALGNIRGSTSVMPRGRGLGSGQCLLWTPDGGTQRDVGATVLYRYQDGALTSRPLWDRITGAFPCGAVVAGVNDGARPACASVHRRLNVNSNGCRFPSGY